MKNLFVFLMMILVAPVLRAQPFQKVMQPEFNTRVFEAESNPLGGFYLIAHQGGANLHLSSAYLYRFDNQGDTLWSKQLPFANQNGIEDMLVLDNGDVLITGTRWDCDINLLQFITRIDTNGLTIWYNQHYLYADAVEEKFIASKMTLTGDGNVYLFGGVYVFTIDMNTGEKVDEFQIPIDFSETWYNNFYYHIYKNELYFAGANGVRGYQLQTGQQTQYVQDDPGPPFDYYTGIVPLDQNRTLFYSAMGASAVVHTNGDASFPNLGTVTTVALHPDGRLAVYGGNGIRIYNSDYSLISSFEPNLLGLHVQSIVWIDSLIVLTGDAKHIEHTYRYNSSIWTQAYSTDGATVGNSNDVLITGILVEQAPTVQELQQTWQGQYLLTDGAFSVQLRNEGDAVLQTVTLNAGFYGFEYNNFCFQYSSMDTIYHDLNLQPGEDTILYLGNTGEVIIDTFNFSIQPWQFCAWTSDPNQQVDADFTNNRSCIEIGLTVATEEPQTHAFSLFPNPATETCTITWGENLRPETVKVYDLYGRLVRSETVDAASRRHELNLAGLINSVYVVEMGGVVVRVIRSSSSGY
ncbi:MAG: T9SS type A sorting domain-containing protein [Saprospiraceae bacterium]|nr:T9SS type A sorting domain-containing protein [Saprospiraceae bacterium]